MNLLGVFVSTDLATHWVDPPVTNYIFDVGILHVNGDDSVLWITLDDQTIVRELELKEMGTLWKRLV